MAESMSRRDREREEHRKGVLVAAERVFAKVGLNGATIEAIAAEAQYAVGSIYNFFAGKEDLFRNVLLYVSRERLCSMQSLEKDFFAHADTGLRVLVDTWISHHLLHGDFLHIAMAQKAPGSTSILPPTDPIEQMIMDNAEKYRDTLYGHLELLKATGEVRNIDTDVMFSAFEGFCRNCMFRARRKAKEMPIDEEALAAHVFRGISMLFLKEELN